MASKEPWAKEYGEEGPDWRLSLIRKTGNSQTVDIAEVTELWHTKDAVPFHKIGKLLTLREADQSQRITILIEHVVVREGKTSSDF